MERQDGDSTEYVLILQGENSNEINAKPQKSEIFLILQDLCDNIHLDFRDFKKAFLETNFFEDEKTFNRILSEGLPNLYLNNKKKLEAFLNAIKATFQICAGKNDKKYKLKHSDFDTVKKEYERLTAAGENFRSRLWLQATFEKRAHPTIGEKDHEEWLISQYVRGAKYFFDAMEKELFDISLKDNWDPYYLVPKATCICLYKILKDDPQIMKRINEKFKRL